MAEIREFAASPTSEANGSPDGLMDVPQVADCMSVSKTSTTSPSSGRRFPP